MPRLARVLTTHTRRCDTTSAVGAPADAALRFACVPDTHQICVVDRAGRLVEVFGEQGSGAGQFEHPCDVIVVSPRFHGEDATIDRLALVAVADRGNDRVQVFEPEGQLVGIIDGREAAVADAGRHGWPFFRLGGVATFREPVRLEWADPHLIVIDERGGRTSIDLALALLPVFDAWLAGASAPMLAAAHHHFRHKVGRDMLAAPLAAIETALGRAWMAAGDIGAAARLWSLSWPAALPAALREAHAAERDRAVTAAAFRAGGLARVAPVRAAIRQSLGAFAVLPALDRERGPASREAC